MVISMTGFGRSEVQSSQLSVTVEIKTVNHRFCEFQIRMPRQFISIEDKLKKTLSEYVKRGRVEVFIAIDGEGLLERKLNVDWTLLEEYYQLVSSINEKFDLNQQLTIHELLQRDEFVTIEEKETGNEEIEQILIQAVKQAGIQLKEMREVEGLSLQADLLSRLKQFSISIANVQEQAPLVSKQYEERLLKKMEEMLSGQIDEARILTEVAIFADKSDINEELTRLHSHIQQFKETLTLLEPVGRKLDFLIQEMNREVNTIGSKANDSMIAQQVVEMKSLLEKMREQVQNIE